MDQIFLRSALTVLAFWVSLQFDVSVWTLHVVCAYDWELGIVAAVFRSHLFLSIFSSCPASTLWIIFAWVWELYTLLIFQVYDTGVFQLLRFLRLACVGALFDWLVAFCTLF